MSPEKKAAVVAIVVLSLVLVWIIYKLLPKRMKPKGFVKKWQELQAKCADPKKWPEVLKDADDLLDRALKKKRIKGKTMGERMVSAQKLFSDNNAVWFGHKLRKKYESTPGMQLTQQQMKKALIGLGKALKDLGALKK